MAPVIPIIAYLLLIHGINGRSLRDYSETQTSGNGLVNEANGLEDESNATNTPSDMNSTFIFKSSDTVGYWRFNWYQPTTDVPIKRPIKDRTMAAHLQGERNCYVSMKFFIDMWKIIERIKVERIYKKSMVPVSLQVMVHDENTGMSKELEINSTYLLRKSDQSDFKFLPWKMAHFDTIGNYCMILYEVKKAMVSRNKQLD